MGWGVVLAPFVAVAVYWLAPIVPQLPKPALPSREITLDSGVVANASTYCTKVYDPAFPKGSRKPKYCEDITVWEEEGVAILSCDPGRAQWNTVMGPLIDPTSTGVLYAYHFRQVKRGSLPTTAEFYPLTLDKFPSSAVFHPLGIDIHADSSAVTLFVINHRAERSVIELFDVFKSPSGNGAIEVRWKRTVKHEKIWNPNAMAPLSHTSVLFTNDHFFTRRKNLFFTFMHAVETIIGLPLGSAEHLRLLPDGREEIKTIARGIAFANGIVISPDHKTVAVAASGVAARVYLYDIDGVGREDFVTLRLRQTLKLPYGPDNMKWAASPVDAPFVVAGHPHGLSVVAVAADPTTPRDKLAAGMHVSVVTLSNDANRTAVARTVLRDDGKWFGTTATGIQVEKGRIMVSALYDDGVLDCWTS